MSHSCIQTILVEYISANITAYTSAYPHANKIYKLSKY